MGQLSIFINHQKPTSGNLGHLLVYESNLKKNVYHMGSVINVISVIIPSWAFKDSRYGHMALSEKDGTPKSSGSSLISFAIPGGIPYFQADPYHEVMTPPNLKNRWFTSSLLIQFLLDMHKLTKNPKNICPHLFLRRR